MVERLPGARGCGLGLDRPQSVRRRLAYRVSHAQQERRHALRSRPADESAALVEITAYGCRLSRGDAGRRAAPRAADGRPGARLAPQHRHDLLGRRGARLQGEQRDWKRLPRAYRLLEADEALNVDRATP